MKDVWIDIKAALRGLSGRPVTLAVAVLCLAFGIGANATMLRILESVFFLPPALVPEPQGLKRLYFLFSLTDPDRELVLSGSTSYPDFFDLRQSTTTFSRLAAYVQEDVSIRIGETVQKARATLLTEGFFELLGVPPVLGRTFSPAENKVPNGSFVAIISEDLWKEHYGGRSDVLGKPLRVGQDLYIVVGVMPRRFTGVELKAIDIWLPIHAIERVFGPSWYRSRGSAFLDVIGRLQAWVSVATAEQELTILYRSAHHEAGEPRPNAFIQLGPVQRAWGPGEQTSARVSVWLVAVSFAVLFIACTNVVNLLIVRNLQRQREMAIRLALGATSRRLMGLVTLEALILAILGGLVALLMMYFAGASFAKYLLPEVAIENFLDFRTTGLLTIIVVSVGFACGIIPAICQRRETVSNSLKQQAGENGFGNARTRWALISAQVTLTLVLLVGSGLFIRSLQNVNSAELGLEVEQVLVVTIDFQDTRYSEAQVQTIYRQALERIDQISGVEHVSLAATIPLSTSIAIPLRIPGRETLPRLSTGGPYANAVSEGFFSTLGTALLQGRVFTPEDRKGSASVAVVNETFARLVWPDRDAIGQCLIVGAPDAPCATIVGVVQDARRSRLNEPATLQVYVPVDQAPPSLAARALLIRLRENPDRWVETIRHEIQAFSGDLPWVDIEKLSDSVALEVQSWKMGVTVFSMFGGLALFLAVVGIYASISFGLAQRKHEMGVRLALGAQWTHLLRAGLGDAARCVALGTSLGLGCILCFGEFIEPLLLGIHASDPIVLFGAVFVIVGTSAVAGYLSTRNLSRVDPIEVLRLE